MTIDEVIKHAEEVADKNECKMTSDDGYTDVSMKRCADEHHQLAEWLKGLKQLREQTKWIPINSGKLPEEGSPVLVWCPERKNIYCAYLEEKQWWIFGAYFEKLKLEVTKWRPLPQLDKIGSEKK